MTGLVCAPYHAGLKDSDREETQEKWTQGTVQIAVATVAFGMGIDLAHVRYVIHWSMAKSLEGEHIILLNANDLSTLVQSFFNRHLNNHSTGFYQE
jgi:hypothetical protein